MKQQKTKNLRELSMEELSQKIREAWDSLSKLRIQQASKQLANPLKIRYVKREKARLITLLKEKQKVVKG